MLKIFSTSIQTLNKNISAISFFRNFRFFSLVFFSLLVVISCGDTTAASSDDGGTPTCPTVYNENPANKAALTTLINYYIDNSSSVDLSRIDISQVTDMSELFKDNTDFNGDISCWDMSSVANVTSMFEGATNFNQDLSSWVLKAGVIAKGSNSPTKMFYKSGMRPKMLPTMNFYQYTPADKAALETAVAAEIAKQGDTADLSIIDTSQVTDMTELFRDNTTFNGYVATWDTSKVKTMVRMFHKAVAFNQPIGKWDTSSVTNMYFMFNVTTVFNQPIGDWNTGSVTDMGGMFGNSKAFNQPIGDWDTSKVKNFISMFSYTQSFNQDLTGWKMAAGATTNLMFDSVIKMEEANKAPWMPKNQ